MFLRSIYSTPNSCPNKFAWLKMAWRASSESAKIPPYTANGTEINAFFRIGFRTRNNGKTPLIWCPEVATR